MAQEWGKAALDRMSAGSKMASFTVKVTMATSEFNRMKKTLEAKRGRELSDPEAIELILTLDGSGPLGVDVMHYTLEEVR